MARSGTVRTGVIHEPVEVSAPCAPADFDHIYEQASGDATRVPWCTGEPNPALVAWLNAEAPHHVRPGASALVVGCGLSDDVNELANRGFDVVGFDISPCAVSWARRRHPHLGERLFVADVLDPPARLVHRFDLVVEVYTVQSLHPSMWHQACAGIASLARPRGVVLAICRARGADEELNLLDGPPYPLSETDLTDAMIRCGMAPTRAVDDFFDDEEPPKHRLRGAFRRV